MAWAARSRIDHQIVSGTAALAVARQATGITGASLRGTRRRRSRTRSLILWAPGADVAGGRGGEGRERGCHDNAPALMEGMSGVREWEGNLYNYNHFILGEELRGVDVRV